MTIDRLTAVLTPRPQRIREVLRSLRWDILTFQMMVQTYPEQVQLLTMGGCGCQRVKVGDAEYSHICLPGEPDAPEPDRLTARQQQVVGVMQRGGYLRLRTTKAVIYDSERREWGSITKATFEKLCHLFTERAEGEYVLGEA